MSDYGRLIVELLVADNPEINPVQLPFRLDDYDFSVDENEAHRDRVAVVAGAGTEIDLSVYNVSEALLVIKNRDDTNFVTATFDTGNTTGVEVKIKPGQVLIMPDLETSTGNNLFIKADTADCKCAVYIGIPL